MYHTVDSKDDEAASDGRGRAERDEQQTEEADGRRLGASTPTLFVPNRTG